MNYFDVKLVVFFNRNGDIAQLARAPALQAGGPGFESLYLHQRKLLNIWRFLWYLTRDPVMGRTKASVLTRSTKQNGRLAQLVRARH